MEYEIIPRAISEKIYDNNHAFDKLNKNGKILVLKIFNCDVKNIGLKIFYDEKNEINLKKEEINRFFNNITIKEYQTFDMSEKGLNKKNVIKILNSQCYGSHIFYEEIKPCIEEVVND